MSQENGRDGDAGYCTVDDAICPSLTYDGVEYMGFGMTGLREGIAGGYAGCCGA